MLAEHEQLAFLLHSRPFRENQCIVDLFTEHHGKVSAITYVSRRANSDKKALLQPFSPLTVMLSGKASLKKLNQIEAKDKRFQLAGNFLYSGFYANEILVKLLPEHLPCPDLFVQYQQLLNHLNQQHALELSLRLFELSLLDELGIALDFSPIFSHDANYFIYIPEQGFVPTLKAANAFDRHHLIAIANQVFDDDAVMFSFKRLMRLIISHLLGNKPIHSRKLFTSE